MTSEQLSNYRIDVSKLGSGYAAVCLVDVTDETGTYTDVQQTGVGRYATQGEALDEAVVWAFAEDMPLSENATKLVELATGQTSAAAPSTEIAPEKKELTANDLIPPDFERCQCNPNVARHNPFTLGPMPTPERCESKPVWLAVEIVPGSDGLHGSMSLCQSCAEILLESRRLRERVQLQPILHTIW
jgi:hypothetical protein